MNRTNATSKQGAPRAPWAWFAGGALASALGVTLHQWPAQWLNPLLNHFSEGRIELVEAQGTLWEGSAHLALGSGRNSPNTSAWSQRLNWKIAPLGWTDWQLKIRPEPLPEINSWAWRLQWQPSGWMLTASDVDWRLPTAWLSGLGAPWNTVQPDGTMHLRSQGWLWQQHPGARPRLGHMSGHITLTLENFATRLSSLRPLGDYQLTLQGSATVPQVQLRTIHGHLHMIGQGHWQNGRLQFQGEAWANQPQDETVLSNLLNVLGPRVGPRTLLKVG